MKFNSCFEPRPEIFNFSILVISHEKIIEEVEYDDY